MGEASDIRVRFTPTGVKDVIDGLRQIRREAEAASVGVSQSFGKGGFTDLFARQTKSAAAFAETIARMRDLQKGPSTPAFGGDFVNLFAKSDSVTSSLNGIFAAATRLIPVLGLAGALGAVVSLGRGSLQSASDVSKLQQQFKLSAEDLTTLRFAVRTNEAANEDLDNGLKGLAKSQRELRAGAEDVVAVYADLGLTARDFQGLNLAQSFELIARAMKGIDPTKLDLDTILGRNARVLIPTLNELADKGLAGVRKEAEKVGAVLSGETVSAAKKSADEMQLLKESVDGTANSFVATFGPAIRAVTGSLSTFLDTVRALAGGDLLGAGQAQLKGFLQLIGLSKETPKAAAGPKAGNPNEDAIRRGIIETSKRQSEEQLKALSDQNRQRRELAEASIEGERRIVEARVAGNRNQIQASRDLLDADTQALRARVQLAQDTARTETDIVRARYQAELQLAQQSSASAAGFEARKVSIDRAFAQERAKIAQSLYTELKRLEADALQQFKTSKEQQKALENELRDIRRSASELAFEGTIAGAGPATQAIEREKRAQETIVQLKEAAGKGDLERARQLRAEIESQARAIAGLDTAFAGDAGASILTDANKIFAEIATKAIAIEQEREQSASKALVGLTQQIKAVEQLIAETTAKPIPLRLGLADSELQAISRQIQEQLGRTPFQIAVTPTVGGGGVPGFADGGPLGGRSPGTRSDNLIFAGTAGEFLHPVAAVRKYGLGFMESVRTGRFPRLADGGMLGGDSSASAGGTMEHYINIGGRKIGPFLGRPELVTDLVDELKRQLAG